MNTYAILLPNQSDHHPIWHTGQLTKYVGCGGEQRKEGGCTNFPANSNGTNYSFWEPLITEMGQGVKGVIFYRVFHSTLNLRYESVGHMSNCDGRKDSSRFCPEAKTPCFVQWLCNIRYWYSFESFFINTRLLLYTPGTVSLALLERFVCFPVFCLLRFITLIQSYFPYSSSSTSWN